MDERLALVIELEVDADSLRGTARDRHGAEVPFVGWLGLIGAIEQLRQLLGARSDFDQ